MNGDRKLKRHRNSIALAVLSAILTVLFLSATDETFNRLAGLAGIVSAIVTVMMWRRERPPPTDGNGRPPPAVNLKFLSFTAVDTGPIDDAFARFGTDWPRVSIAWPDASATIPEKLQAGLRAIERASPGDRPPDADEWIKDASRELNDLTAKMACIERGLPAYVQRIRELEGFRKEAVARYLQRAHWTLFAYPAGFVRWPGLRRFGIDANAEWDSYYARYTSDDDALRNLLDSRQALRKVYVLRVGGKRLDNPVWVAVPEAAAEGIRSRDLSPGDFASYVAPGLELALCLSTRNDLPEVYPTIPVIGFKRIE